MSGGPLHRLRTSFGADAARFLVAGGLNTLLTLVVYQALLFVVPHQAAYALAWASGIAFVMIVYPSRVFPRGRTGMSDRIALGASYAGMFLFGLALLEALTYAGVAPRLGILVVMVATTAANFIVGRLLLRR
ncbi:GtrA family protein [Aureimonas mangrovi]|uniref:GtrA family protein n=1 Tax=Aureimonas mangrovi TaxID=2758041 RepID=UPI00163DC514|nr:GtrA family protein [Aureimonas mangrovi]